MLFTRWLFFCYFDSLNDPHCRRLFLNNGRLREHLMSLGLVRCLFVCCFFLLYCYRCFVIFPFVHLLSHSCPNCPPSQRSQVTLRWLPPPKSRDRRSEHMSFSRGKSNSCRYISCSISLVSCLLIFIYVLFLQKIERREQERLQKLQVLQR